MGTGTVALTKTRRPLEPITGAFDREAILERLFALPVPPSPGGPRRTFPIHTPLGRIMRLQGKRKRDMVSFPGTPSERRLTEILSGRITVENYRVPLAAALGVDPRLL